MKLPKWNGTTRPGTYLFWLVCFIVGIAVLTVLFLGQVRYDDREGPGWNPITTLPNGKVGISEFAIGSAGFFVLMALGWLVTQIHFR
jgi:hypothetical protein